MSKNSLFALVLIVFGIAAFTYEGFTYKTREKAVDLGSLQVTAERTRNIPVSPIVGIIAIAGGIVLLMKRTHTV